MIYKFSSKILNNYNISYFYCENCGFLRTEAPYWLNESYKSVINLSDTGILSRNIYLSKITSLIIYFFFDKDANYLDFGGGYGIFTRIMRDIGLNFYWYDPYCNNILSKGFEYDNNKEIELITSFESFEHLVKPLETLENMLNISRNILFTTELLPKEIPEPNNWWYYGLEHGQHISFYSRKTLEYISKKYNLNFYTNGRNIHLFSEDKLDIKKFRQKFTIAEND